MPIAALSNATEIECDHFNKLYRDKRRAMIAYATSILGGDVTNAEDSVDEAFADIWKKRENLAAVDNVGGWLRQIVRNKSIDYLRKAGRIELHGDDDLFERQISPAQSPEDSASQSSDRRWLEEALNQLNGYQREAIVLCYFEDLSLHEIAQETGTSLGTVKTRLYYARRKLADTLQVAA